MHIAWAKSPKDTGAAAPLRLDLTDHSVDVAVVAEGLMTIPTVRRRLEVLAGRRLTETDIARTGFFVGLHDIGKVNHGFQARLRQEKPDAGHIGPVCSIICDSVPDRSLRRDIHKALRRRDWKGWFADKEDEAAYWNAVFAHHGGVPRGGGWPDPSLWKERNGCSPLSALADTPTMLKASFPQRSTKPRRLRCPLRRASYTPWSA